MTWRFAELQFNGIALHNLAAGWEQGEPENAPDGAPYRTVTTETGGAHFGGVARGSYGFGELLVPVRVRGTTQAAFDTARQRLARTCAGYGVLRARVPGKGWVTAKGIAQAPFAAGRKVDNGTEYGVPFVLASFWTTESNQTQSWTINSTNQLLNLTQWADATAPMTDWIAELRGGLVNPEVSPEKPAGSVAWPHTMIYRVNLTTGQIATIDTTAGGLTITGSAGHTANYTKFNHPASPYPLEILPGSGDDPPKVRMKSTGSLDGSSRLTLTGPIAYLGV